MIPQDRLAPHGDRRQQQNAAEDAKYQSHKLFLLFKQYGITSTLLAAGTLGGAIGLPGLAQAANSMYQKRFKNSAKHTLKFGAAGFNERNLLVERAGCLDFVNDLEERSLRKNRKIRCRCC